MMEQALEVAALKALGVVFAGGEDAGVMVMVVVRGTGIRDFRPRLRPPVGGRPWEGARFLTQRLRPCTLGWMIWRVVCTRCARPCSR